MIAGKGHEQGQEFADGRKLPFDDVDVARDALRVRLDTDRVLPDSPTGASDRGKQMREWDAARDRAGGRRAAGRGAIPAAQ